MAAEARPTQHVYLSADGLEHAALETTEDVLPPSSVRVSGSGDDVAELPYVGEICDVLRVIASKRGQAWLADLIGVTQQAVSRHTRGESLPRMSEASWEKVGIAFRELWSSPHPAPPVRLFREVADLAEREAALITDAEIEQRLERLYARVRREGRS